MRKDELAYSLEEATASLKKLQEQSRGTEEAKEDLGNQKVFIQDRIDKITSSLKELQTEPKEKNMLFMIKKKILNKKKLQF